MTIISFTASELLRDSVVEQGWYTLDIQAHRTWTPTKDGQSNNCHFDTVVVKNADTGSTEFAGVPITLQFNDKPTAQGFLRGFLRGLNVDIQANTRYDLNSAVGKQIDAFLENDMYNGRVVNRCNHKYRVTK